MSPMFSYVFVRLPSLGSLGETETASKSPTLPVEEEVGFWTYIFGMLGFFRQVFWDRKTLFFYVCLVIIVFELQKTQKNNEKHEKNTPGFLWAIFPGLGG